MRQIEDVTQELEGAQKEAVCARYDAEIAKNEWIEAKKELQEKIELVQLLKLECKTQQWHKRQNCNYRVVIETR
ncbi:hypothetical protein K1719_022993 [Acacia pycnantha]|nr:hypothetical protein K1719_022993 [Acacia pycnantha]